MGIKTRINQPVTGATQNSPEFLEQLYREERSYRADKLVEKWARVPEIGTGLKNLDAVAARNTAIMLENQSRVMKKMSEAQLSSNFYGYTPENMLRLIRLSYPNSIRGKIFTEFAMETSHDSIKYIRPVYTNSQTGGSMDNRTWQSGGFNTDGDDSFLGDNYRSAMYESSESRYATELVNGTTTYVTGAFTAVVRYQGGAFDTDSNVGVNYIPGSSAIYFEDHKEPLAVQDKTTGSWYYGHAVETKAGCWLKVTEVTPSGTNDSVVTLTFQTSATENGTYDNTTVVPTFTSASIVSFGRFNSEQDLTGQYLGEVELVMTDYHFRPRPILLGVTWTQLTELVLDTSFGISAEEMLNDAAAQEIKKSLDFSSIKYAVGCHKQWAKDVEVTFDAEAGTGTKDSYYHTAQLIGQAIDRVGDLQFNKIKRGGVSRLVGGPAAVNYLKLNTAWTTTGKQAPIGGYQAGELDGIPVFKVPADIIPDNQLLTVWKNPTTENDVSIAIGTLLPFYSTGTIQRKNLYKEGAVARFEDMQVLQPKYLGMITIKNIRELAVTA